MPEDVALIRALTISLEEVTDILQTATKQAADAETKFHQIGEWFFNTSKKDDEAAKIAVLISETAEILRDLSKNLAK